MDNVGGKVAFITGGASGISLGLAKVLVKAGAKVVMADVCQDHLDRAFAWFDQQGQKDSVLGIQLDVSDRRTINDRGPRVAQLGGIALPGGWAPQTSTSQSCSAKARR
jgi:NAD(P)-dependent dehydrogenase (short-subunit alcohol dehydrogenase family)